MKNKHLLSLTLTLALLLGCFAAVIPATATTTTTALYDEHLVAFYDFEGETDAEKLADKATAGKGADVLTATSGVTVTDGVAYVPHTKGEYLNVTAANAADVSNIVGKTVYLEFKAADATNSTSAADVFTTNNTGFRFWLANPSGAEAYKFGGRATAGTSAASTHNTLKFNASAPTAPANSGWYYLAFTVKATETGLTITTYNSADGSTYVSEVTECTGGNTLYRTGQLVLGKNNTVNADDRGLSFYFNQFRIYDTVMTADQIQKLSTIIPGQAAEEKPEAPETTWSAYGLDKHLVTYYDFEGTTAAEQLADKAPNGNGADVLTATSGVTVTDGVAYVPHDKGELLKVTAANAADVSNIVGKTVYLEFKAADATNSKNAADVFTTNNTGFRFWLANPSGAEAYKFGGQATAGTSAASTKNTLKFNASAPTAPTGSDWYYAAFTVKATETGLTITTYNSADGSTYVSEVTECTGGNTLYRTGQLVLGKTNANGDDRGISYYFNQFRVYDTVLTADQIATLSATTPVTAPVHMLAAQERANGAGSMDVRLVGHLNLSEAALADYSKLGFEISATYAGDTKPIKTVTFTTVYNSILAEESKEITIADFDCTKGYLIVLPIYNVPTSGTVTFTVKPFCEGNGSTAYGKVFTVTYTDGAFVSAVYAAA